MTRIPRTFNMGLESLNEHLEQMRTGTHYQQHGRDTTTILRDQGASVILIALNQGSKLPEHHAPSAITVLILEGRIAFQALGQTFEALAHDLITLEAGATHMLEALEPSAVLVTIMGAKLN